MLFLDALHSKRIFFYLGVKTWRKEFCNWFFPLWNKHIYLIILINLITEILFQYRDVSSFLFYFKWKPVRACYFSSLFLLYHKSTAEVFHCVWACVVDVINLHPPLHDEKVGVKGYTNVYVSQNIFSVIKTVKVQKLSILRINVLSFRELWNGWGKNQIKIKLLNYQADHKKKISIYA